MEIVPWTGNRHPHRRSVRLCRSAHRLLARTAKASRTTLAQIIADEIGVTHRHDQAVVHGDTDRAPYGWGTFASRSLVISGGASLLAARKLRGKLIIIASHLLETAAGDIVLENGTATVAGTDRVDPRSRRSPGATPTIRRTASTARSTPGLPESAHYDPPGTFSNACHVAIVEVDIETGRVTVEKFLAAEDAGRIINPMIADGQVHGGIAQGIGNALLEEIIYDEPAISRPPRSPTTCRRPARNSADRIAPPRNAERALDHRRQGPGRRRRHRRAGRGAQRGHRRAAPFGVEIYEMPETPQRIRAALRRHNTAAPEPRMPDKVAYVSRQRPPHPVEVEPRRTLGRRAARGLRADGHASRLRARRLRRVHGSGRRSAGALLPDVRRAGGGRAIRTVEGLADGDKLIRCNRRSGTITGCNAASARRAF